MSYYSAVSSSITAAIPGARCQMNKVPKPWAEKDTYCQMVHNTDHGNPDYDIMPRIWAFEISTVIDNHDILFFSKIMSRMWPHAGAVVKRLINFADDSKTMNGF